MVCNHHYLHKWPAVVMGVHVMRVDDYPVGVIVYAMPPRETEARYGGSTWELARLWVDDAMPRNSETWFVAQSMRILKRTGTPMFVVSYADPAHGHKGIIYRAGNWQRDGMTDEGRKTPRHDYVVAGKRYGRSAHAGTAQVERVPRGSKYRYMMQLHTGAIAQ
jgi:hypothetical protein